MPSKIMPWDPFSPFVPLKEKRQETPQQLRTCSFPAYFILLLRILYERKQQFMFQFSPGLHKCYVLYFLDFNFYFLTFIKNYAARIARAFSVYYISRHWRLKRKQAPHFSAIPPQRLLPCGIFLQTGYLPYTKVHSYALCHLQ